MHSVGYAARTLFSLAICLPCLAASARDMPDTTPTDAPVAYRESATKMGLPVIASQLDDYRGGHEVSNVIVPNGYVQGNAAINVVTGSNAISDGAFSSASGFPIAIQNTGANVLIQSSMIVNVQIK